MKKNKLKMEKYVSEEVNLIRNLIIILIVVALFIVGFYFLTALTVSKNEIENVNTVEINYDNITVGTILNRPYDEYLVLLYNSKETDAIYYNTLLESYSKDAKLYFVDLSLKTNESYIGDKSSGKFTDVKDAKFSGPTLLIVKDGKIDKFLETKEEIKNVLK